MPITEITYQPNSALNSAYRPIIYRCKAKTGNITNYAPPVVYCDVYVNTIYYKTLMKTQFVTNDGIAPEYEFDIQDALQELMDYEIPKADGFKVQTFFGGVKSVFVRFRNAIIDANNFTVSEQFSPVMATSDTPAQAGAGTQSGTTVVVNTLIQHEENMNLKDLLNSYKTGTWDLNTFPLTKRPKKHILGPNDSSHFPILTDKKVTKLCLVYKTLFSEAIFCVDAIVENEESGGGGGGTFPPVVFIKWNDSFTTEDRSCYDAVCNFVISVDKTDPDNDILTTEVLKSTDMGVTWTSFIPDLAALTTFSDSISDVGTQWYKVKVTDAVTHIVESNALKISKQEDTLPTYNFYFSAVDDVSDGIVDRVMYKDAYGNNKVQILIKSNYSNPDNPIPAPCTLIIASSITSVLGAEPCTL